MAQCVETMTIDKDSVHVSFVWRGESGLGGLYKKIAC